MTTAYQKANIPTRFHKLSLETVTIDEEDVEEQLRNYVDKVQWNDGTGLLFVGPPGRGKSMLASLVLMAAIDHDEGLKGHYTSLAGYEKRLRISMDLKDAWTKMQDQEAYAEWTSQQQKLHELRNSIDLLVLDDVGKEHSTERRWIEDEFDFLFRYRFDKGLATIVTTNLPVKNWESAYSPSMQSFIHEACIIIPVMGRDRRM